MKLKKESLLLISLAAILLIIAIAMVFFIVTTDNAPEISPEPTLVAPTASQPNPRLPVRYDKASFDKLVDKVENKIPLTSSDTAAKERILSTLPAGKTSGLLHETPIIRIDYTSGVDLFQVEILTTNIKLAKDDGVRWFRDQGISQQGICDLPVDFYLNWEIANVLRGENITFNPLAEGC